MTRKASGKSLCLGPGSGLSRRGGGPHLVRLDRLDNNRGRQFVFEGQFGVPDPDDGRRRVLKHVYPFAFVDPVSAQLLAAGGRQGFPAAQPRLPPDRNVCQRSPRVPCSPPAAPTTASKPAAQETAHRGSLWIDPGVAALGAAQHAAVRPDRTTAATRCRSPVDRRAAHRAAGRIHFTPATRPPSAGCGRHPRPGTRWGRPPQASPGRFASLALGRSSGPRRCTE